MSTQKSPQKSKPTQKNTLESKSTFLSPQKSVQKSFIDQKSAQKSALVSDQLKKVLKKEWITQKSLVRVVRSKKGSFELNLPKKCSKKWVALKTRPTSLMGQHLCDTSDHQRFLSCISGDEGICFFSKGSQWMDWS